LSGNTKLYFDTLMMTDRDWETNASCR